MSSAGGSAGWRGQGLISEHVQRQGIGFLVMGATDGIMRVAVVSHAYIVAVNRAPWEAMARKYPVELFALAPRRWRTAEGQVYELEGEAEGPGEIIGVRVATRGHPVLHWWWGLGRLLRRLKPDVIFLDEEPYSLPAVQLSFVRSGLGAAVVLYAKQNIVKRYPPPFCWAEQYFLRTAEWMMAVAPLSKEVLEAKGCRAPISVVPHVVDPEVYSPGPADELKAELGLVGPVVGYVGRLVPEKGVIDLLEAAAILKGQGIECSVLIVGDGPERPRLEGFARQELGAAVRFVGMVPHVRVPEYYRCMDVLVLPSHDAKHWREQFGRTIVEALACGVAVVGSDGGSIPGVISMTAGEVYRQGDAGELATVLGELLRDEDRRRQLAEKGRRRVLESFTAEAIGDKLYEIARKARERYERARQCGGNM